MLEAAEQGPSHEGLSGLSKSLGRKALLEHKDKVWGSLLRLAHGCPPFASMCDC